MERRIHLLTALVLVALMVIPVAAGLYTSYGVKAQHDNTLTPLSSQSEYSPVIPDINKVAFKNPALNIGPGFPFIWISGNGTVNMTVILKSPIAHNITKVYLGHAIILNGQVEYRQSEHGFYVLNDTAIKVVALHGDGPGLYDLILELDNGTVLISPQSVWHVDLQAINNTFRFIHMSDVHFGAGTPNETIGQNRRFAGYLLANLLGVDAILNTGDEADTASANQYKNSVAFRYDFAYGIPMFLNPGNHDYPNRNFIKYYGETTRYAVIGGKILIVTLNTDGEVGHADVANMTWLKNVLEEYKDVPIKIIMMHHPIFYYQGRLYLSYDSNSSLLSDPNENRDSALSFYWGSDLNMTRWFLKLVEDYNVTMVLAGHIHRDQYVEYHSTRTGTVTYFETTTTLAHGTGTYQGLQVVDLNLTSGIPSYPFAPSWFIGYENHSRRSVYNSIPVTMPQYSQHWRSDFNDNYYYGWYSEGKTGIVFTLYNMMPTLNINRTVIISLPWPERSEGVPYTPHLEMINAENASVELLPTSAYAYGHIYLGLHFNLPPKSEIEFVIYTENDYDPPNITLKRVLPRNPEVNKPAKAYITVSDDGWGIANVSAEAHVDSGTLEEFNFHLFSGNTYIAEFKVNSTTTTNLTITVTATDYAGNTRTKNIVITLAGPTTPPPENTTTAPANTTTTPPTNTTQTTTTTPPQTTQTTTSSTTTTQTTTTPTGTPPTSSTTTTPQPQKSNTGLIAAVVVVIIIIVVAGVIFARK
ncbi:MAG: metallophosphoesterase [Desulfurococcales archaeon]|nr:metallophosphoesterase [Desulfurococcales archaeon]